MKINRRGFTLAELLIVVAIIGVLVGISIPIFTSQLEKSKQATDLANMRSAKAAALSEWMNDHDAYSGTEYKRNYDAAKGVMTDAKPEGYGQSSKSVTEFENPMPGASGIPNPGEPTYITVSISGDGTVSLKWASGNDLSTAEGRKQEDLNNMYSIAEALEIAVSEGKIKKSVNKNFVCVTVYPDGTVDYFSDSYDGKPRTDDKIDPIKQALADAGINESDLKSYASEDGNWKYGYTVMYDYNCNTMYLLGTSKWDKDGLTSNTWSKRSDIIEQYKTN